MSKRVARTEAAEQLGPSVKVGDKVWFFERVNGHSYEHLARIERVYDDAHVDLTWQVAGELGRSNATKVPALSTGAVDGGWFKA